MYKFLKLILVICFFQIVLISNIGAVTNPLYKWKQSSVGGGGYITGLIQHPSNPDILYGRCDVAGVFKSTDRGKSWTPINNGTTEYFHHSVDGFAISPHHPNVIFRCSGDARGNKTFGSVHKSTDGGNSWYEVCRDADFFGNGPNRMMGEKITVDPFNPNNVALFSYHNGVFVSTDEGETFHYSGLKGEPGCVIAYHPYKPNTIFAGTRSDLPFKTYLYPNVEFQRPKTGKLFVSNDNGITWNVCFESQDIEFLDFAFDSTNENVIFAATQTGIFKSIDGGKSFEIKNIGLPKAMYTCITADKSNPGTYYTAARRTSSNNNIPVFPVFVTTDFGKSWNLVDENPRQSDFVNYPSFLKSFEWVGWAISKIIIDNADSKRLFTTNWWGVSVSDDGGKSWNGNNFRGTETLCIENVIIDPLNTNNVYFSLCDHNVFKSEDSGKTYKSIPKAKSNIHLNTSSVVCPSMFKSGYILYGITDRNNAPMGLVKGAAIVCSTDGGKSSTVLKYFPDGHFVQAIKEDYKQKGRFYAYIDGETKSEAGIYCTDDWGKTWTKLNLPFPGQTETLPFRRNWIETELLPVVYYQVKNCCGTNQLLCVDPFRKNTLYVGEYTSGIFCSTDAGRSWINITSNLPFNIDSTSAIVDIKADNSRAGVLYAGFVKHGLWRTVNYGKSWSKVYPTDNSTFNATSTVVGGKTKNELFMASEPLYYTGGTSAILYSADKGRTWVNVMDSSLGAIRWKGIAVNKKTGTIHAVSAGNGCFYANLKKQI